MTLRCSFRRSTALTLLLLPVLLHAATPNRIGSVGSGSRVELAHSVSGRAQHATDLGPAPTDRPMENVSLFFGRTDAQQAALTKLLIDQQNPASSRYHQWLTPIQFGAQFGLSPSDISKVSAWLTSQGLTLTYTAPSNNVIRFSGTVGQIQQALGTSIHLVSLNGEQHISNVTNPHLPAGLATVVTGVAGLSDFRAKPRLQHLKAVQPKFTSGLSLSNFIGPQDFYTIYDVNPLLTAGINGTGVTIAVVGETDLSISDVAAFRAAAGLAANNPTVQLIGADPGVSSNPDETLEAQLDVEWSGAVAPNAKIVFVNSQDVLGTSLISAISNNVAPIISISYGLCEQDSDNATLDSYNAFFQEANALGQTIVGPAGDSGATDCDFSSTAAADGLAVDFPASSPFVTGIGGTTLSEGTGAYWKTTTLNGPDVLSSALSYIPETAWNDTVNSGLSATGGGASIFFSKPYWQTGSGVPADFSRDVPDVSLAASPNHDPYLICANASCVSGFRDSDTTLNTVGGTSVGAPSFAGVLALLEQKVGGRIGNANPILYSLANSTYASTVYHDIVSGNNQSPCIQGSPNCPSGTPIGFSTTPGYDQVTGLGTVNAFNLVNSWLLVTPATSSIGATLSATTITSTAAICGISSGSIPLTIQVANDSGQASTAIPSGTVQILVDGIVTGTALPVASGSVSYTLNTSALSSGSHTVSASYTGDGTFAGSKGTLSIDVVSATAPDFSITPCSTSISVVRGGTASGVTFTVNPFNGFTGSVAFTASADTSLAATTTFSVNPVAITSTAAGTTVFTLTASTTTLAAKRGTTTARLNAPHHEDQGGRRTLYTTGSGIAIASLLLITLPKRRRWTGLLVAAVSIAAIGAVGCGSSGTLETGTGGTGTTVTTPATPGTYFVTVTGIATTSTGTVVHSSRVQLTVN